MILSQFPKSKGFSIVLMVFIASDVYGVPQAYTEQLEQNITSLPNERVLKPNIGSKEDELDDITFPEITPIFENVNIQSRINDIEPCLNDSFCDDPNYPLEMVNRALDSYGISTKLFNVDKMDEEELTINGRIGDDDEETLCPSRVVIKQPQKGLAIDGTYKFIVNTDRVIQKFRLELCTDEERGCSKVTGEGEGYVTVCKQKQVSRQLMALSKNGSIEYAYFPFPASCCCHAYLAIKV